MYSKYFKRCFDFTGALLLIAVLSPIYVAVYFLVRFNMGSPAIFTQDRPGKGEKIFRLYKFRSMTSATDADGKLLPDAQRLTKLGKFLRETSLDEIPQFFNVLKGDMSFIGPRPLLVRYLPYYTKRERLRHSVRPGITGLAQVNGRNCIGWDEKLAFDVQYAENVSLLGDIKIALSTVEKVLKHSDIKVGMENFLDVKRKKEIEEGKITLD
ncbi:MAG: sugar transferase [Candidatus Merdousia sp.]|nr:sugar transferase [Candidatus Merdousia sp.]